MVTIISHCIFPTAAEWIVWGLEKGAEKTGVLLKKGSDKLKTQITPDQEEKRVDPGTQKGIYYARQATSGAVKVSAFIGRSGIDKGLHLIF